MGRYTVYFEQVIKCSVVVEADTPGEAQAIVEDMDYDSADDQLITANNPKVWTVREEY